MNKTLNTDLNYTSQKAAKKAALAQWEISQIQSYGPLWKHALVNNYECNHPTGGSMTLEEFDVIYDHFKETVS